MAPAGTSGENRTRMLLRGLYTSGLCLLYHDADLAVRMVENVPPSWPEPAEILARGDAAIFDPYTAERVVAAKRAVLATGIAARLAVPQRREGRDTVWFDLHVEQDSGESGGASGGGPDGDSREVRGLFVSVTDITEIKQSEEALRGLLFEVSHRTRNMLAILQSVLGQTARHSGSVGEFEEKFRGRIASLARSQDLITASNWRGVRFRRLAEGQIAPFARNHGNVLRIDGADPMLSPNTALHLGLALHELAANSHAFGALDNAGGTIGVSAEPLGSGHRFAWIEKLDEPRAPVAAWGFGHTVLKQVVPRAVRGAAEYAVEPDEVRYSIDLPSDGMANAEGG